MCSIRRRAFVALSSVVAPSVVCPAMVFTQEKRVSGGSATHCALCRIAMSSFSFCRPVRSMSGDGACSIVACDQFDDDMLCVV